MKVKRVFIDIVCLKGIVTEGSNVKVLKGVPRGSRRDRTPPPPSGRSLNVVAKHHVYHRCHYDRTSPIAGAGSLSGRAPVPGVLLKSSVNVNSLVTSSIFLASGSRT